MSNVWCVRADSGKYTDHFVKGGYAAIGFGMMEDDLSTISNREDIYPLYRRANPQDTSDIVVGQQVGQVARFLLDMKAGDYIITPVANSDELRYGKIEPDPSYFHDKGDDGCPYRQRRRVKWSDKTLRRGEFSVPFQNTIRSTLTVFTISQRDEFLTKIGAAAPAPTGSAYDPYRSVLEQILQLDAKEFEILVGHLLTALGFEGSEVTGKVGDGGVDATGELNIANLAKVKIFVQAKRYKPDMHINANTVKQLRQAIPRDGQGAFITTADFQKKAHEIAQDPNFPRIGLVNGRQLVDLLVEHWNDIPKEFQELLGLKPGLVRV